MPYSKRAHRVHVSRGGIWGAIVAVIVLMSLLIVYQQANTGEQKGQALESDTQTTTTTSAKTVTLSSYTDEQYGFTVGIPDDWTYVLKDGYATYIHAPSATSLQIQIQEYTPCILNVTKDSAASELTAAGFTMTSFSWDTNSSYSTTYVRHSDAGEIDTAYIEYTVFDRQTILRLVYTVNAQYVERMSNVSAAILDSFSWNPQKPVPDGTYMYYSEFGNYEFAYPATWTTGTSEQVYFAQDPQTGASMSIRAVESAATYAGCTQQDYINFASGSRSEFQLTSYSADDHVVCAQATYTSNGQKCVMIQYLLASGTYEYTITFETTAAALPDQAALFQDILAAFRTF